MFAGNAILQALVNGALFSYLPSVTDAQKENYEKVAEAAAVGRIPLFQNRRGNRPRSTRARTERRAS